MADLPNVTAAPVMVRISGRDLLISPLTFRDLGCYDRHFEGTDITPQSAALMLYLSCRRENRDITMGWCLRRMCKRHWHQAALSAMVSINPGVFASERPAETQEPAKTTVAPFTSLFESMARILGWPPTLCADMTPSQMEMFIRNREGAATALPWNSVEEWRQDMIRRGQYPQKGSA